MPGRSDRVVVVTGASSGVGRAVCRALAAEGTRLALVARGLDGLRATAAEVEALGGESLIFPLDLADAGAVDAAADRVVDVWGHIDVWINNAMVSVFSPIHDMHAGEYRRVTEVNYLGTVHGTLAALRHMRRRDRGLVVQIGSALAYRSIPLQSAYCASKAAVRGFTDSLRCELAHEGSGVRVTMLQLPALNTPQFDVVRNRLGRRARPVGTIYQPEVVARAVLHAIEHPSRELWVGWSTLLSILGQRFVPGRLDRYLADKAWDGQSSGPPVDGGEDNVDAPLPGDRGAHGAFDDEARGRSGELWARTHRAALLAATLGVAGLAALWQLAG
jgi:NADP-dependent 3-hydroxy acid dehydrogenase YdfG